MWVFQSIIQTIDHLYYIYIGLYQSIVQTWHDKPFMQVQFFTTVLNSMAVTDYTRDIE